MDAPGNHDQHHLYWRAHFARSGTIAAHRTLLKEAVRSAAAAVSELWPQRAPAVPQCYTGTLISYARQQQQADVWEAHYPHAPMTKAECHQVWDRMASTPALLGFLLLHDDDDPQLPLAAELLRALRPSGSNDDDAANSDDDDDDDTADACDVLRIVSIAGSTITTIPTAIRLTLASCPWCPTASQLDVQPPTFTVTCLASGQSAVGPLKQECTATHDFLAHYWGKARCMALFNALYLQLANGDIVHAESGTATKQQAWLAYHK
jgi:hypothetical protein